MQHRARQGKDARAPRLGQPRKQGPARVRQAEQLGALVEGLAGGIVQGFAEQFVLADAGDLHQLRMPAGDEQRDERKGRRVGREQRRKQMPLEVMDRDRRPLEHQGQRLGEGAADEQRAGQSRTARVGHRIDVGQRFSGLFQRRPQQGYDAANMVARGELGHHAAVVGMHRHLRMQVVREQAGRAVVERQAGLVAGGFDTEDQHRGAILTLGAQRVFHLYCAAVRDHAESKLRALPPT